MKEKNYILNEEEKIDSIDTQIQTSTNITNNEQEKDEEPLIPEMNNYIININNYYDNKNEIPEKKEPKKFLFYKRRIEYPKQFKDISGFIFTIFYFIIFSILITICLKCTINVYSLTDGLKKIYNFLIIIIWISSITTIILLIDVFTSDPGQQRGEIISKEKYINSRIKKIVKGQKYSLKYCDTCHIIRDIRTFHCNICGICVEKHDHHCVRISNCIGVYNYKKFYAFVNSSLIYLIIMFGICFHYLNSYNDKKDINGIWIYIVVTLISVFDLFFFIFTLVLDLEHIKVIISNITTREFIKNKRYNAYDKGCKENCKEALCRSYVKEI